MKTNSDGVLNRWPRRGEEEEKKMCMRRKEQWLKAAANEASFTERESERERRVNR